jgi:recombination protein RecT
MSSKIAERLKASGMNGMNRSDVVKSLELYAGQIEQALPKHLSAERIIHMVADVMESNPKLKECTPSSIIGAVMQASVLGFRPSSQLGECYFVPYGKQCQFQIGYQGWLSLARRSGEVKTVYAHEVHENDLFDYELGLEPKLTHKPTMFNRGKLIAVYCVVHYSNGGSIFNVLSVEEVERRRLRNPMQKNGMSGAWATDYGAMAKGKAVNSLKAYLPLGEYLAGDEQIIELDKFNKDQSGTFIAEYAENQEAVIVEEKTTPTNEG